MRSALRVLDKGTLVARLLLSLLLSGVALLPRSRAAEDAATASMPGTNESYPYIVGTVPVAGYVKDLAISSRTPTILYALAHNDGQPQSTAKAGLYVFDTTDARRPVALSYLPILRPEGMELHPRGSLLFVHGAEGVMALDVSNPKALRVAGEIEQSVLTARLSYDGARLFVAPRSPGNPADDDSFNVYTVSPTGSLELETRVKLGQGSRVDGFLPLPDAKSFLVQSGARELLQYEIASLSQTPVELNSGGSLGYPHAIGRDGRLYLFAGDRELVLATTLPAIREVSTLQGNFTNANIEFISADSRSMLVSTFYKRIQVIDVSQPSQPKTKARYAFPHEVGSAVVSPAGNLMYVGLLGSIAVVDPSPRVPTAAALIASHAAALLQHSDESGRGCGYQYFELLNAGRNAVAVSPEGSLLQRMQERTKRSCNGTARWFRHEGATYYETRYREDSGNGPQNFDQSFHQVVHLDEGRIRTVCDADIELRVSARKQ